MVLCCDDGDAMRYEFNVAGRVFCVAVAVYLTCTDVHDRTKIFEVKTLSISRQYTQRQTSKCVKK